MTTAVPVEVSTGLDLEAAIRLKAELLVAGIRVDPEVLGLAGRFKPRVEQMYRHHIEGSPMVGIPQEVVLHRPEGLLESEVIAVQIRNNIESDWRLSVRDGGLVLHRPDLVLPVGLVPLPSFYDGRTTAAGTEVWRVVQLVGTDLLGVVPSNFCSFFGSGQQCRFCELMPNYRADRTYPRSVKPDAEQREALHMAIAGGEGRYLAFTTGNYDDENRNTLAHLCAVFGDVEKPDGMISYAFFMPPRGRDWIPRLRDAGFDAVGLNLEVWRSDLFPVAVPGKHRHLGRSGFLDALQAAVPAFGSENCYTNLVYGIQSLDITLAPGSFDPARENDICLEATTELLRLGILPLFTLYHSTGANAIGRIRLDDERFFEFAREHGRLVFESGLVPAERNAMVYGLGSIPNHYYNDLFYLAKTRRVAARRQEVR